MNFFGFFPFNFFFYPPPPPFCSGFYYMVQSGDSLYSIGQRYGVSLSAMIAANPQVLPPNYIIYPGQIICVPRALPAPPPYCSGFYYTVQPGESLYSIGQRYGVSLSAMIAANPQILPPNYIIYPGQIICVPRALGQYPPPPPFCSGFYYIVRQGDSLYSIGQRYGVSLSAMQAANPQVLPPNYTIYPGQTICVPRALGQYPPPPAQCSGFYYVVRQGDSLYSIGQRYGVSLNAMIAANPQVLPPNYTIYPGQTICVPRA